VEKVEVTSPWVVVATEEFEEWMMSLTYQQRSDTNGAIDQLRQDGPTLGRPYVDTIRNSRFKNMKELRVSSQGALRVLFAFDPKRRAVLLLGGDKSKDSRWNDWYVGAIQRAGDLFEEHIRKIEEK
jgi:hypothetical protein